jgi:hypothetical protein
VPKIATWFDASLTHNCGNNAHPDKGFRERHNVDSIGGYMAIGDGSSVHN